MEKKQHKEEQEKRCVYALEDSLDGIGIPRLTHCGEGLIIRKTGDNHMDAVRLAHDGQQPDEA